MTAIYILWREVSDQTGKRMIAGVYTTLEKATEAAMLVTKDRTYVEKLLVDRQPIGADPFAVARTKVDPRLRT